MTRSHAMMVAAAVFVVGGLAIAGTKQDLAESRAVNYDGGIFGWSVQYLWPPDPCIPPDPCKAGVALTIDADQRTDLNQQVVFRHNVGGSLNPCVKVLHRFLLNGSMASDIDL